MQHSLFPTLLVFQSLERPFSVLSDVVSVLTQTRVSADRLIDFFKLPQETAAPIEAATELAPAPAHAPALRVTNLCFRNARDGLVLDQVDVNLEAGKSLAIVGPVGAGKTLLLSLLLSELEPSEGRVEWSASPRFAYCAQEPFISSGSLRDNLLLYSDESKNYRGASAIHSAGLLVLRR